MKSLASRVAILLTVAYVICAPGSSLLTAQTSEGTGTIVGTLVDEQGKPVSGTLVTAAGYDGVENGELKLKLFFREGRLPEMRTDDKGRFRIAGLPAGKWLLRTQQGFFDKGGFVQLKSDTGTTNHVLIIDVKNRSTFDAGTIHLRE